MNGYHSCFLTAMPAVGFTSSPQLAEETAFRNSSMQAAYLIVACRALGLDTGPMSGFDRQHVDDAFLRAAR